MKNNLFEKCLRTALLVGLVALPTWAAETLFSNYAMNVTGSGKNGELWVFSRSGTYSGVTLLNLNAGTSGIQVNGTKQGQVSDSMTAMQDGIYSGVLAEHRRISSGYAGKVGYVLPMYGMCCRCMASMTTATICCLRVSSLFVEPKKFSRLRLQFPRRLRILTRQCITP